MRRSMTAMSRRCVLVRSTCRRKSFMQLDHVLDKLHHQSCRFLSAGERDRHGGSAIPEVLAP